MGETFSKPNPTSSPPTATATPAMSPPQSSAEAPESETPVQESPDLPPTDSNPAETQQDSFEEITNPSDKESAEEAAGDEEEEEGECGFCLFMKGGGCKDTFVDWENCVEEGEKNKEDIVDKCFEVTSALKKCMEAHSDYYAPLLDAEKAAEAQVAESLKKSEDEKEKDGGDDETADETKEEAANETREEAS